MSSLWFVPGIMLLASALMAVLMVEVSARVSRDALIRFPRLFGASAQSSRDMLATIAGAMMTVAGVTFSITVLAVAQASSQYTPRLLRNFMRDRANQVTLGTLTGVFVYCLVVMRTIRGAEELLFIPAPAVLLGVVLAIVAIGVLIYFIHHIAESLAASHILARVRDETLDALDRAFAGTSAAPSPAGPSLPPGDISWQAVPALATGYITHFDPEGLFAWCGDDPIVLKMEHAVGDYVIAGTTLLSVGSSRALDRNQAKSLNGMFAIAPVRTIDQDPVFGIRLMVDIAVKALSPGVNDTTTAIASIDAISAVLYRLAGRPEEAPPILESGDAQLMVRRATFSAIVGVAIDEIRRSAGGNVNVLSRLLTTLTVVSRRTQDPERLAVLHGHADQILALAERTVPDPVDREQIAAIYRRMRRDPGAS